MSRPTAPRRFPRRVFDEGSEPGPRFTLANERVPRWIHGARTAGQWRRAQLLELLDRLLPAPYTLRRDPTAHQPHPPSSGDVPPTT